MSANNLASPPKTNRIEIRLPFAPVSLQAKPANRSDIRRKIRSSISSAEFYLSGEVEVEIEWRLHARERYQGVHSPDIDNILKPIIDALSGPSGVIVNDCQVQSVRCAWIDGPNKDQSLLIVIRFQTDEYLQKRGLEWVEVSDKLCMPLNSNASAKARIKLLKAWKDMFALRKSLASDTGRWEFGQIVMPVVQPFHRARLSGFRIIQLIDLEECLERDA